MIGEAPLVYVAVAAVAVLGLALFVVSPLPSAQLFLAAGLLGRA